MANSPSHQRLVQAIERLRLVLLPDTFDPTGSYIDSQGTSLRAVSFRVLAHAEIEAYIEDIALELLETAWKAWKDRGVPSLTAMSLLAFSGREHTLPPSAASTPNADLDACNCMQKAQGVWRDAHRKNHGLKEENVLRLFLPLGVQANAIDTMLLADLSSFGTERGAVAHSATTRITQYVDPETEYKKISQLVQDLTSLDALVCDLHIQLQKLDCALALPPPNSPLSGIIELREKLKVQRIQRAKRRAKKSQKGQSDLTL